MDYKKFYHKEEDIFNAVLTGTNILKNELIKKFFIEVLFKITKEEINKLNETEKIRIPQTSEFFERCAQVSETTNELIVYIWFYRDMSDAIHRIYLTIMIKSLILPPELRLSNFEKILEDFKSLDKKLDKNEDLDSILSELNIEKPNDDKKDG
jgi:hypothetical protein